MEIRLPSFTPPRCLALAAALALAATASPARAQDVAGRCATPDSVAFRGNVRVADARVRTEAGLSPGQALSFPVIQRAVKALYALEEFDDVQLECDLEAVPGKVLAVVRLRERAVLGGLTVTGPRAVSERSVKDKIDLLIGRPIDPVQVARSRARIDSTYEKAGYYLARVTIDSTILDDGRVALTFRVDEGRRLAISGIDIVGNRVLREKQVAGAMKTRPEGFWFFRKGEYDDDRFVGDLGERIPALYARQGFVDMRILRDTLIVERERGKGLLQVEVEEGPRYRVGSFEVAGNRRFPTQELKRYYPFEGNAPTLTQRVKGLLDRGGAAPKGVFDQAKWDDALEKVNGEYRNNGYLYATVRPVVERTFVGPDSVPTVNLRWEIDEKNPAIVNRIEIVGNDFTSDDCIRRQIFLVPGGPFNQQTLIRSYQSIGNLNFFESPMPFPDYRPVNEQGDVDIVFRVKEKRTGSINFGASMGQGGVGFGGFIGVEQPNLFGLCKRGQLNWQYGRFFNDFTATYTDPALRGTRVSGALSAYRTQSRFIVGNLGQNIRTGSQLRIGLPVPWSYFSTLAVSYNAEAATFTSGQIAGSCSRNCFRSNVGLEYTSDTRVDLPFATGGSLRTVTTDFSGGPLGGTVNFQRVTTEMRAYALLGQLGGGNPGAQPVKFSVGITARAGALFGNSGPFFFQQQFAVGGVMFGQQLRGYPEFSITPQGFNPSTDQFRSTPESFGNAFMTVTAEVGVRFNQMFAFSMFTDAGNNWAAARQINPARMFRSAGFGVSTVTPLGPLGLDLAYGFDRTAVDPLTLQVRPDPRWQFHFRLGQLF
ncbi:MAG: outer membrane protein assembly factor BamA [Gemmatimonadetes bacterium]|nr:outer membrane protein assembly factor BamA [Gemmatimonadota bacterium]